MTPEIEAGERQDRLTTTTLSSPFNNVWQRLYTGRWVCMCCVLKYCMMLYQLQSYITADKKMVGCSCMMNQEECDQDGQKKTKKT
jgi:hypothetical protein